MPNMNFFDEVRAITQELPKAIKDIDDPETSADIRNELMEAYLKYSQIDGRTKKEAKSVDANWLISHRFKASEMNDIEVVAVSLWLLNHYRWWLKIIFSPSDNRLINGLDDIIKSGRNFFLM